MNPDPKNNRTRWTKDELLKAEATASQFLEDNSNQISETLRAKMRFIELLIQRLGQKKTTLDERLDCFARIGEVAKLVQEDADGFFNLASQPVVARMLLNTKSAK